LHGLTGGGASVPGASRTQSPAAGALDLLHGLDSAAQRQGAYIAYLACTYGAARLCCPPPR